MKTFIKKAVLVASFLGLLTACSGSDVNLPTAEPTTQEAPVVVGAISTSNTTVLVTFSSAMNSEAENATSYSIVAENVNSEAGALSVTNAAFLGSDNKTILLTTLSQNEIAYKVTVVNVQDSNGQPFLVKDSSNGFYTADNASFAGTPPGAAEVTDFDGDGLLDNEEQLGYTIFIEMANGEVVARQVTSDPTLADTDGDGVSDGLELQYGMNPRSADTDGDTLDDNLELNTIFSNPYAQDTDLDGLQDGFEHVDLHTSPLLADTDGDKLNDNVELFELNRDPLVADLPKLRISVGDVRLQIDERYSYSDETGNTVSQESSTNTTLSQSNNTSYNRSDITTHESTGGGTAGLELGSAGAFGAGSDVVTQQNVVGKITGSVNFQITNGTSTQIDRASARESQQAYDNSLSKGKEFSTSSSVSREVVGARLDVDLSIENVGNIPFTISNLEITVLQPSPIDSRKFVPVATLVSNSELITGTPLVVNMGPFSSQRGPFLFANREIFPNLVEALMRNPRGLIFKIANYDVTDELGRNYAYSNQVARDRTTGIVFDFGDAAAAEQHYAATSGAVDDQGYAGGDGRQYVGGFSSNGTAQGLPLDYILQARLGLKRHDNRQDKITVGPNGVLNSTPAGDDTVVGGEITTGPNGWLETSPAGDDTISNPTSQDGIVAGLNKTADSIAQGDDIQLIPFGTTGLSVGSVVIGAGDNGLLDTPALEYDTPGFVTGYETSRSCTALSNKAGDICRNDANCACQPGDQSKDGRCVSNPVSTGSCSGPQRLTRINSLRNGDFNRAWFIFTDENVPAAADFGKITVKPGSNLTMAFMQDLDKDGLAARHEFTAGSIDSSVDSFTNTEFGTNFDEAIATCATLDAFGPNTCDDIADSKDTDRDGLGDFAEVRVGWKVAADGGALRQVYSSPYLRDSDGDLLLDPEERDLRGYCASNDPRVDGLCAFQSDTVTIDKAIGIIAGLNKIADSIAQGDDIQLIPRALDASDVAYGTPVIGPGPNGTIETALLGDDVYESLTSVPPATDPSQRDTDQDGVSDFDELKGYDVGLAIIDGGNGIVDITSNGDDVQKVLYGNPVSPGGIIILPGANGTIDTTDAEIWDGNIRDDFISGNDIYCGPDGISDSIATGDDVQEIDPGEACAPTDLTVSPGNDGVLDTVPNFDPSRITDVRRPARTVTTDPLRRDTDNDTNSDGFEIVLGSDPTVKDGDDFVDSDKDGLTNNEENELGWMVSVGGAAGYLVKSSASLPDTDSDGLPDFIERDLRTDPNKVDTDDDGISDYDEVKDFVRYVRLMEPYPNVIINGSSSMRYGTSPINKDSDGDTLTDYAELIEGFRYVIAGSVDASIIYTSPLYKDTDLDGLDDKGEIDLGSDPTNADTDGDGRTDGDEFKAGSDPLVPDRVIIVRYTNMQLKAGANGSSYAWQMKVQGPAESYPGTEVTNVFKHHQNTDHDLIGYVLSGSLVPTQRYSNQLANGFYCGYAANLGNLSNIWLASYAEKEIVMHQGDTVTLSGNIFEYENCTVTPIPVSAINNFRKTFSYDEIVGGTGTAGVFDTQSVYGSDSQEIGYEIIVK